MGIMAYCDHKVDYSSRGTSMARVFFMVTNQILTNFMISSYHTMLIIYDMIYAKLTSQSSIN